MIGIDTLENKAKADKNIVDETEKLVKEHLLANLKKKKELLTTHLNDTSKRIKDKNVNLASKVLSIEKKCKMLCDKMGGLSLDSRSLNHVEKDLDDMTNYYQQTKSTIDSAKTSLGNKDDNINKEQENLSNANEENLHQMFVKGDKKSMISYLEKFRSSLATLENQVSMAEKDMEELNKITGNSRF